MHTPRRRRSAPAQPFPPEDGPLAGYLCERCLDAPAMYLHPAPWGGEYGRV